MLTRRQFVGGAAAAMTAWTLDRTAFAEPAERPVGVQLYTVRGLLPGDLNGTLAAIRKIGYRNVETFVAEYKMGARDLRSAILNAGLKVPSAHFGYNDFDTRFDYARELGVECIVCSMIPQNVANSADGYKRGAEQYNKWGEQAKKMGMRFGFHNHNVEFRKYGDVTGFDVLMRYTDPALVQWQMDCYWVAQAGHDPVAMLRRYGHRMQSLHLKDRKRGAQVTFKTGPGSAYFTEVGEGTLDWTSIFRLAAKNHIPYMFVEQDQTDRPPLQSLQISYRNIEKLLKT
ncbi:MAG: sugar phosphate isomerase/epimerase family protein [Terracidiphilus sp.]